MSDANPLRAPDNIPDMRHLELIEYEVGRHRQNALRIRMGTVALVAIYVALHGSHGRYMFLAPVVGLAGWMLDAHADWNVRALRMLSRAVRGEIGPRPAVLSLDTRPWADLISWRSVLLRPARAALFHPLVTLAAYVSVDAQRLDGVGFPSELFWYLAVTFLSFLAVVTVAWSWWYDHFGDTTASAVLPPPAPALGPPDAMRSVDGPFPTAARSDRTRPFGTAVS